MIKVVRQIPKGNGQVRVSTFKFDPACQLLLEDGILVIEDPEDGIVAMFRDWAMVMLPQSDSSTSSSDPDRTHAADEAADEPSEGQD